MGKMEQEHDQGEDCSKAAELISTGNTTQGSGCFVHLLADTGFKVIPCTF